MLALAALAILCGCSSTADPPTGAAGGAGGQTGGGEAGQTSAGGAAGQTSSGGTAGSASAEAPTALTGSLGNLGAVQPTISSLFITNSGETLVYLSSAVITCEQLKVSRWLGAATAGSQVVEIVIHGAPVVGTTHGEVNYAEGGKSSAYEKGEKTDTITFTTFEPKTLVAGKVAATYEDGSTLQGSFRATFCPDGQGYLPWTEPRASQVACSSPPPSWSRRAEARATQRRPRARGARGARAQP